MSVANIVLAILGLALLMVVHEGGHYLAARNFGMRVVKFSIGFGPTLWKHQPKGSPTIYQVALIPFLAYVQIAGMNPYEENDPKDPGSYVNASLWARTVTIAAGPLTNYLFASVLIFAGILIGGKEEADSKSMKITVDPAGAAAAAQMKDGDQIVSVGGAAVADWDQLKTLISAAAGDEIEIVVRREGEEVPLKVTPAAKGEKFAGKIMIGMPVSTRRLGIGEAFVESLKEPPMVVYETVRGLVRLITGKEKPDVAGPVGIVKIAAKSAEAGPDKLLKLLGALSAYLGAFNLLPFPALDGGRLMFLGFEAVSRRRPDAKVEAGVHAVGLLVLLGVIVFVTYLDFMPK